MRVKICGITNINQAKAIADFGADSLGFICVSSSPRYIDVAQIKEIVKEVATKVNTIGVFVNENYETIIKVVKETGLTGVQLHGEENPQFCEELQKSLPKIEIIKAIRVKNSDSLDYLKIYFDCADTLLLDAYNPKMHGGTGKTLNWKLLTNFNSPLPWFLAGGLTPDNINDALTLLQPDGIDLSSGVEIAPGNKDLIKVRQLFEILNKKIFEKT
jgi:phosphoribosylanthranilate isomerase